MNKKYLIIGLLVALIASFILVPLLKNNAGSTDEDIQLAAEFTFPDNLATKWGEAVNVDFDVKGNDVAKVELFYNDSLFHTWNNPHGVVSFMFKSAYFGLGTRNLELKATRKNGESTVDSRMIRVLSDVTPAIWIAKIVKSYPHNVNSFTQGLEFNNGTLYEGTGQRGQSLVAKVNMETGEQIQKMGIDATYFGEGISILGDKLYQLTWQEQTLLVYDKNTLQPEKSLQYIGEGWGLCNDGKQLIMSDGSERITFRDPKSFTIQRTIEVYTDKGPVTNLNELEYIDSLIYANVWTTDKIVVIDPNNGKVIAQIDGSELVKEGRGTGDVLNGIAYNPQTGKLYMTGKDWPKLFEVSLQK